MDNARLAFDYFVSQGLSPVQAAGIVGNLQGESGQGLNPLAVNPGDGRDGSDSVGIAQWNAGRAQALKDYAASKGSSWNDLNTQLEFLHQELKGPESAAYSRLLAAKTPEEAGQAMLAFERPKDWNKPGAHPERGQYAAKVFAAYGGGQPVAAPETPASPPSAPLMAPQQAPIFPAAQPQAQPQGGSMFASMPAEQMQAPPIFFAPRRAPDLSKLRSAFKAPIFRGQA
ncbi:hypothetical protein GWE18_00410 [Bradyrhizobium sp. CSA112]|uniref:phage tail tip lysozyme n=1 Tax=Bradyrhizobium sp. CSA112 TaxID=2699170 RepID=UPI0023AFA6DD|nr:phage tail tip lysozyme [Bradyrhizobium sp. CSA112]MDE5451338.1 hypothetical protein [Bradyrhizobium sp. CSA112]